MHLSLRLKIILSVAVILVALFLSVVTGMRFLMMKEYLAQEQSMFQKNAKRALRILEEEKNTLDKICLDWANWDDARKYVETGYEDFREINLKKSTFEDLSLDLLAYLRPNGEIVYSKSYDEEKQDLVDLPGVLSKRLTPLNLLKYCPGKGIIMPENHGMLMAIRPVLNSDGQGQSAGYLVLGRNLDEERIDNISRVACIEMKLIPLSEIPKPIQLDLLHNTAQGAEIPVVRLLDKETANLYLLLRGLDGAPLMTLCISETRDLYQQGLRSLVLFTQWLVGMGLLVLCVAYVFINRFILMPLAHSVAHLKEGIVSVASSGSLANRIESKSYDELQALGNAVNQLMSTLKDLCNREHESQKEAMENQKLASLGIMVAGLAHEINNPTCIILMNATLLSDYWKEIRGHLDKTVADASALRMGRRSYGEIRNDIASLLQGITDASMRIEKLVSDLRGFSRRDTATDYTDVDLNRVVESSISMLQGEISKYTSRFSVKLATDLPVFRGNFQNIQQVVMNLVMNSLQALPERTGAVVVETSVENKPLPQVVLTVQDEGKGIAAKDLPLVFTPFYSTRQEQGGMGLGLAIVRRIIDAHRGKIDVSSQPGKGTVIRVLFPEKEN